MWEMYLCNVANHKCASQLRGLIVSQLEWQFNSRLLYERHTFSRMYFYFSTRTSNFGPVGFNRLMPQFWIPELVNVFLYFFSALSIPSGLLGPHWPPMLFFWEGRLVSTGRKCIKYVKISECCDLRLIRDFEKVFT